MTRESTIKDIKTRLSEIAVQQSELVKLINAYTVALADLESLPEEQRNASGNEIREGVFAILQEERPLKLDAIHQRLTEMFIRVGGENPIANTGAHLSGKPMFKSDGKGNWTLDEDHLRRLERVLGADSESSQGANGRSEARRVIIRPIGADQPLLHQQ